MTNVLIIGATGSLGRDLTQYQLNNTDNTLTLMSRTADRLNIPAERGRTIAANVHDPERFEEALKGQDIVYAALSGNLGSMAKEIVAAMNKVGVKRLIFITSMGIYNEIPPHIGGNLNENPILGTYRDAADVIEASHLDYTIIRPGWFDNGSDDYEITLKGEPFGGRDVSRRAISLLVSEIIAFPDRYNRDSIGINRP